MEKVYKVTNNSDLIKLVLFFIKDIFEKKKFMTQLVFLNLSNDSI